MKTRSIARKETQDEIRQRGGYLVEQFRPGPVIDRNEKKEKLQNPLLYAWHLRISLTTTVVSVQEKEE